jgi:membrane protease YdiL (CAAX protease family)
MSDLPAAEAVVEPKPLVLEPVDIQHDTDPAEDHGPARRIPHLGHAFLFFTIAFFFINLCALIVFTARHIPLETSDKHPGLGLAAQALAYAFTLLLSAWLFPRFWHRGFLRGIEWNFLAFRRRWYWVIGGGILLSATAQTILQFIPTPDKVLIDELLRTPREAWLTAAFAVLFAPLVEEIAFRGFLLPALATAYDWLALDRTPAGLQRWQNSALHSTPALIFSTVFSSVPFALLHAGQLSHAWGVLGVLYGVSVVFSFMRIRTHSVACSTLTHATYNLSIFAVLFLSTGGFRHLENLHK